MPEITLKPSDALAGRLEEKAKDHNDRTGTAFTVADWILFHLREMLVSEDLTNEAQALERKSQRDLQVAIFARKNELMGALDVDGPAAPVIP
jgi:hypothetical protein